MVVDSSIYQEICGLHTIVGIGVVEKKIYIYITFAVVKGVSVSQAVQGGGGFKAG